MKDLVGSTETVVVVAYNPLPWDYRLARHSGLTIMSDDAWNSTLLMRCVWSTRMWPNKRGRNSSFTNVDIHSVIENYAAMYARVYVI